MAHKDPMVQLVGSVGRRSTGVDSAHVRQKGWVRILCAYVDIYIYTCAYVHIQTSLIKHVERGRERKTVQFVVLSSDWALEVVEL